MIVFQVVGPELVFHADAGGRGFVVGGPGILVLVLSYFLGGGLFQRGLEWLLSRIFTSVRRSTPLKIPTDSIFPLRVLCSRPDPQPAPACVAGRLPTATPAPAHVRARVGAHLRARVRFPVLLARPPPQTPSAAPPPSPSFVLEYQQTSPLAMALHLLAPTAITLLLFRLALLARVHGLLGAAARVLDPRVPLPSTEDLAHGDARQRRAQRAARAAQVLAVLDALPVEEGRTREELERATDAELRERLALLDIRLEPFEVWPSAGLGERRRRRGGRGGRRG